MADTNPAADARVPTAAPATQAQARISIPDTVPMVSLLGSRD